MSEDHEQFPMDTAERGITPAGRFLCDDGVRQVPAVSQYVHGHVERAHPTIFRAFRFPRFESRQDRAFSTRDILFVTVILLDTGICTGIIARPLCTVCAPSNILPELARPPPLCAGSADIRAVDSWQNSLRDVGTRQRCVKKCFGQKLPRAS